MPMNGPQDHAPGNPQSTWCKYCSQPDGSLGLFEERFERMVQWSMQNDKLERAAAEQATRQYMRTMPLWKDHPSLVG